MPKKNKGGETKTRAVSIEKQEEFLVTYGRAVMVWTQVESTLCVYFRHVTKMESTMARRVFYSATGFKSRTRMLSAAIGCPTTKFKTELEALFFKKAVALANEYCTIRNKLAHDNIVYFGFEGHPNSGEHVIVDGKYDRYLGDEKPLTLSQLQTFHANESHLFRLLQLFLQRSPPEKSEELAERYFSLLQKLPNPPHERELDPIDVALLQSWMPEPFQFQM